MSSKKSGRMISLGQEMLECTKKKERMPVIEEILSEDEPWKKDLKQLLIRMTKYRPEDREQIQNVDKELESNFLFLLHVCPTQKFNILFYYTISYYGMFHIISSLLFPIQK